MKRALIDFFINLPNGDRVKPDLLAYLNDNISEDYELFEFKKRSTTAGENELIDQYQKYLQILPNNLDRTYIPVRNCPIFINYIFYNSDMVVLNHFLVQSNFRNQDCVIVYSTQGPNPRRFDYRQFPLNALQRSRTDLLLMNSSDRSYWNLFLVPFTPNEINGITGLGGSPLNVSIDLSVSLNVLMPNLLAFIVQRKSRELPTEFTTSDFFDFIFSHLRGLAYFHDDDRLNMERKLRHFLNYVTKVCAEQNYILIQREQQAGTEYSIRVRQTANLYSRLETLVSDIQQKIDDDRKQMKLDSFL